MYSRKKLAEELPEEDTAIWYCENEGCNGWMRDNFSFSEVPTCMNCGSPMVSGIKSLPLLVNTNKDQKTLKMGVKIQD